MNKLTLAIVYQGDAFRVLFKSVPERENLYIIGRIENVNHFIH